MSKPNGEHVYRCVECGQQTEFRNKKWWCHGCRVYVAVYTNGYRVG